ncbi:Uncharacterized protein PBTT_03866 [Plasmodiophora brassicae]
MASPPGDDAIVEIAAHHDAALEVALTAVDHIVAQSACILHEHYLDARIPSIVASDVVAALLVTIKSQIIRHDPGDADGYLNPIWVPENEPRPAPIDKRASGMLPILPRKTTQNDLEEAVAATVDRLKAVDDVADGRESTISGRSRSSKKSSSARRSSLEKRMDPGTDTNPNVPITVTVSPEDEERELFRLRHMHRLGKERASHGQAATPIAKAEPVDPVEEQFARVKDFVKGRPYTYDHYGKPVIVAPIKPERMPPTQTAAEVVVQDAPVGELPAATPGKRGQDAGKPAGKRPAKERKQNGVHFVQSTDVQPPISQSIQMAAGVTLREGPTVKMGTRTPVNDDDVGGVMSMTLSQYKAYLETDAMLSAPVADPDSPRQPPAEGDVIAIEARVVGTEANRGSGSLSPVAKFNEALKSDANWGANPGQRPRPPAGSRAPRPTGPRLLRTPRTRPFIETTHAHLPHPIFPTSKGHAGVAGKAEKKQERRPSITKVITTPLSKKLFEQRP